MTKTSMETVSLSDVISEPVVVGDRYGPGNEPKITPEFLTKRDSTNFPSRLRRIPPLPGANMQPIVAKYDADRWYSEVVTFVLFGA